MHLSEHHQPQYSNRNPVCPACDHRMELTRVIPRGSYILEQLVFQCDRCEIAMTRAGDGQLC